MTRRFPVIATTLILIALFGVGACKKKPPVARATPPPPASSGTTGTRPPAPPEPVVEPEPVVVPPDPTLSSSDTNKSLDDINKQGMLQPLLYELDSAEVSAEGQQILAANAEVLTQNPTWVISIEGHCDERGTAEYNLALGERRALAARTYLVSLGLAPDRVRTVSYGKEFPFDPNHNEAAWAKNRRAHFVVTAK